MSLIKTLETIVATYLRGQFPEEETQVVESLPWEIRGKAWTWVGKKLNESAAAGTKWLFIDNGRSWQWWLRTSLPRAGEVHRLLHVVNGIVDNVEEYLKAFLAIRGEVCFSEVQDLVYASRRRAFLGIVMDAPVEGMFESDVHSRTCPYTGARYDEGIMGAARTEAWVVPAKGELFCVLTDCPEWHAALTAAGVRVYSASKSSLSYGVEKDLRGEVEPEDFQKGWQGENMDIVYDLEWRLQDSWRPEWERTQIRVRRHRFLAARSRRAYWENLE